MSSTRLLIPLFLVCSLCAVGQSQHSNSTLTSSKSDSQVSTAFPDLQAKAVTPAEPWRIIPRDGSSAVRFLPGAGNDHISISEAGNSGGECYAIRSYVVARDSKDSEATHPVAYSTCQPASRYQLRKTVGSGVSGK